MSDTPKPVTIEDILAEFDKRAAPGVGFYEPQEPAEIIRAMPAGTLAEYDQSPVAQPAPSEPAVAEPTAEMVAAYLNANRAYWQRIDAEPGKLGKWRNGTAEEATAYGLRAALAALAEKHAAEVANFKTVMVAAAEEIHAHWDAHCDAEGYGPANLMRRLEEGIAAEYGYTTGNWARLTAERDALRADRDSWKAEAEMRRLDIPKRAKEIAERDALRAQVDAAVPAMRDYARRNPRWELWDNGEVEGKMQDPNGANAWIEQIDAAIAAQGEAKPSAIERELFEGE